MGGDLGRGDPGRGDLQRGDPEKVDSANLQCSGRSTAGRAAERDQSHTLAGRAVTSQSRSSAENIQGQTVAGRAVTFQSDHHLPGEGSQLRESGGRYQNVAGSDTAPPISPPVLELSMPTEENNVYSEDDFSTSSEMI